MKRRLAATGIPAATRFEQALGCAVYDEFALYQEAQERSKRRCGLL
ncbi:Putative cytoplasmic protein [Citrobacter freundii]|uniref:Cytoplasmic protein n=1 Tax=Citrobacter freundii TaxID=546 RepID=A0A7G2ITH1_CITFR|nr:Putative cytoplasmic protein [Citrobacter freundii]